ncbi:MAG: hypothetical protein KDC61_17660 [Saprospiraceae bacterium]|nr:hypothetical protein [Saprospiraceae bacterium]MCB0576386.1 hypothetical protein [Saprospiraceae bacterium]MCB9356184.1 hypothetical protein [Lewinellaceae bacterium]
MARLTTFSRLLITLAIVAGLFFGIRYFFPQLGGGSTDVGTATNTEQTSTQPSSADNNTGTSSTWGKSSTFTPTPFSYSPPVPSGGKLMGVVELGTTGFNSFIIRVDRQKNWKLEKAEFGVSLVKENLATDEDIKSGLRRFIADMVSYGVGPKDIHFVISSGATKAAVTQQISAALKGMGYFVNEVTPQQEARYALRAALPTAYQNKAFVVDIGSGNTKISWLPSGALESYGAKYYQDNTPAATVYSDVKNKATRVPSQLRGTCFIIGGVPYELAKQSRSGKERYTLLKAPGSYTADGAKQESGLNIYQAISDATGCKQFVFDWDANFTIGFLLNL